MGSILVIVESPAKSKKIQSLLGAGYRVSASVGHVRDLPEKDLGVDLETFRPTYVISPGKKDVVDNLKRLVKMSDEVILATDPDREGEAIAWHLKSALNLPDTVKRVSYQEITQTAIKRAMDNPRRIDMNLVAAQESRRVLDRLIGYLVSPALSKRAGMSLSAGRVQSVAVRFVVDRERAIKEFKPRGYQVCTLRLAGHPTLTAALDLTPFVSEGEKLWMPSEAAPFVGPQQVQLASASHKSSSVAPRPPFTTVALQGAAGKLYGFSAKEVMAAAQALFEQGLITYHRTDFPNLSDEGIAKIQSYLRDQGLPVADTATKFKSKGDAQEAHEAIRPTDISVEVAGATDSEKQVYALIRERALLSVMPAGVDAVSQYIFVSEREVYDLNGKLVHPRYIAKGKVVKELGWRAHAKIEKVSSKDAPLPNLEPKQTYQGSVSATQEMTKPPSRFNEQTLIKALEAKGIGRPSTYAAILENIKGRQYIVPQEGSGKSPNFIPGKLGYYIVDALQAFSFMGFTYTRAVESSLDKIAKGSMTYKALVEPVAKQLQADIDTKLQGDSLALKGRCPGCQQPVVQKFRKGSGKGGGKGGRRSGAPSAFWVHVDEAHGEACVKYLNDDDGAPVLPPPEVTAPCPLCTQPLLRLQSKKKGGGAYWAHKNKDDSASCGTRFFSDEDGAPVAPKVVPTATCVECGGALKQRTNSKTQQPLWVHDADKPKCGKKFLDDVDGVPANAVPEKKEGS